MYFHACLELVYSTPVLKQVETFRWGQICYEWISNCYMIGALLCVVLLLSNYHFLSKTLPIMKNLDSFYLLPHILVYRKFVGFAECHGFLLGIACIPVMRSCIAMIRPFILVFQIYPTSSRKKAMTNHFGKWCNGAAWTWPCSIPESRVTWKDQKMCVCINAVLTIKISEWWTFPFSLHE